MIYHGFAKVCYVSIYVRMYVNFQYIELFTQLKNPSTLEMFQVGLTLNANIQQLSEQLV